MEVNKLKTDLGNNGFPVSLNYFSALPDVNLLPSASLAVIFKSLMKKDSKTKEKSLEEFFKVFDDENLIDSLKSSSVIEAWIQLYPKLSFDNSRSVRFLVHKIQLLFLKTVGGKAFSKYLKSSLPIWLLSIYDSDKTVASQGMATLLEAFDNDEDKVNQKIWKIFISEILKFIEVSLTLETQQTLSDERSTNIEDAAAKKERLVNSSIQMLIKVVTLVNDDSDFCLTNEQLEMIQDLLDNDNLWNCINTCFSPKTFNASVCNSFLVLLKSIFQEEKEDKSSQNKFCINTSSARSLYKHTCKRFFKNIFKTTQGQQSILFGSVILQFWSTLIVMTRFSQLEGTKKPKENMWEISGNSEKKLISYLSLGPCNQNAIYFILVETFLKVLYVNVKDFFDLNLAKSILNCILSSYSQWTLEYKSAALSCITHFINQIPTEWKEQVIPEVLPIVTDFKSPRLGRQSENSRQKWLSSICEFLKLLDLESRTSILTSFSNNVIAYCETGKEPIDVANFVTILNLLEEKSLVQDLISKLIDLSSETDDQNSIRRILNCLCVIIQCKQLPREAFKELIEFTTDIGQLLERETIPDVNKFLFLAWDTPEFSKDIDNFEIIDDVLTKYEMIESDSSEFIEAVLKKFKYTYNDCTSLEMLTKYFDNLKLKSKTEDDWSVLFDYLDEKTLEDTISNLKEEEELGFIKSFNNRKTKFMNLNPNITAKVEKLLQMTWNLNLGSGFIKAIRESSLSGLVVASLWNYTKDVDANSELNIDIFDELTTEEIEIFFGLLDSDLKALPNIDKSQISLSNSIGANIHLVEDSPETDALKASLLGACYVFAKFNCKHQLFTYYCGILSQYLQDFIFTMNLELYSADELLNIQTALHEKFVINDSLMDILDILCQKDQKYEESSESLISFLNRNLFILKGAYSSYNARIMKTIMERKAEQITFPEFNSYPIDFNHLLKEPLKLLVILSGLQSFLKSPKFDRIRNYVAAEILGVRNDSILTIGLKWVVLCLNFLEVQENNTPAIPSNRLNMVLSQFDKWLDSDISYDDSFLVMRSQLIKFLSSVESSSAQADLTSRLLEDNLSMISLHSNHELMYFTLKYLSSSPSDKQSELLEILFDEKLLNKFNEENNMVTNMCQDVLERCFNNIQFKEFEDSNLDKFYQLALLNKFIQVKRICVKYLQNHIALKQRDLVINYQFKKADEIDEFKLQLPVKLMDYIRSFDVNDYTEIDHLTFYVAWYLVLLQFEDINFQIRNEYITEIKNSQILSKFLDFIFVHQEIDNTKIIGDFEDFDLNDVNKMAINLYFLSCKFLGSEVQNWFKELRNIQLKNDVDKFTRSKVSTILIEEMLGEVESGKSKLTTEMMNIKINRVIHEVRCVFEIDEQTMEMVIKIPSNFPLSNVSVEGPKRIGLKENQWKAWLLSSQRVISLTNGSIIEAIEVFKRNVDLHFSGFEECAICYSILHQDHSLPSKKCSTCNNKFHAACLYKWFKSSGTSTCPLCRQTFNFRN